MSEDDVRRIIREEIAKVAPAILDHAKRAARLDAREQRMRG